MDNSFIQSQHPVVEELLTNKYFGDTLLVCANGHLTDNKLAVGLLFPCLLTSDIFALPIENVLLVPDYTMEEIGREFEKLILGGSFQPKPPEKNPSNNTSQSSSSSEQTPETESNSTSSKQDEPMSLGQAAAGIADDNRSAIEQEETSSDATNSQLPQLCAEDSSPQLNHNDSESPPVLEQIPPQFRQQQVGCSPLQTIHPSSNVQTVQNVHSVTAVNTVGNIQSMHPSVSVQNIQPIVTVQTGLSPAQGVHTSGSVTVQDVQTAGSVHSVHTANSVQGVHLPINGPVYMTPLQKPDNSRQAQPYQSPYHTPTLYQHQPGNQVHQSPVHMHQSPVHIHQSPVHLHQSPLPHHQPVGSVHSVQQPLGVPVYTSQQYSTGPLPTTLQYSTNSNSRALVTNNNATAVVFSPQPYTNTTLPQPYTNTTLQYQELGNVQPLTSIQPPNIVQSTSSQMLPGSGQLLSNSSQILSNSGQMLPGSSQPLASGSGTTYTNLNYQTSSVSGEEYHDTSIPDDESDRENEDFVIYREPKINEVSMGNGYSESCDVLTDPSNLNDDDSIVFYLNEQEASSSESSNAYQPSTSDSTSIQTSPTKKKSVTFKEPVKAVRSKSRRRTKKELLKIEEYEDTDVAMIQNLKDKDSTTVSVNNQDNESPIVEDRKPGRPKTKPPNPNKRPRPEGEITRFKRVSAVNVDKGKYKCTECEKVLSCQGSLNRHMLVHSDGKPFKCKYCDKSFREQSKKSTHERVHTGSKPFPCKICDQSFRTATQRRVHLFRHTKDSEWRCGTCNQAFAQKFHLKRHKEKRKH